VRGLLCSLASLLLFAQTALCDTDLIYNPPSPQEAIYAEPVNIILADVVASPGREVLLTARVERREKKLFKSVANTKVEFLVDGSTAGQSKTNKKGIAQNSYFPEEYGNYLLGARLVHRDLFKATTAYALFSVLSSTRPVLLIDFDSTLFKGLSGKFQFLGIERLRPISGASEVLNDLSKKYTIFYMTEWDISMLPKIRRWIFHWKMVKAPILSWDTGGKVLKDINWKSRQLKKMLKKWRNIKIGVGGRSDVMRAYKDNKLKAIAIRTGFVQEPGAISNWRKVGRKILELETK